MGDTSHIYTLPWIPEGLKAVVDGPASTYDIGVSMNGYSVKLRGSPWSRHKAYAYHHKYCL
jgi:hypothetical protein